MLFAPVLPLCFPLLNLSVRDRNDAFCQPLERSNGVSDFVGFDASTSEMTPFFPKNAAAREVALIYLEVISGT
jgi:hypothetical protein